MVRAKMRNGIPVASAAAQKERLDLLMNGVIRPRVPLITDQS